MIISKKSKNESSSPCNRLSSFKQKRKLKASCLRCVRDSNSWPQAWQACILTDWTNAPFLCLQTSVFLFASAKVQLFSELTNFFTKKMQKNQKKLFFHIFFCSQTILPLCLGVFSLSFSDCRFPSFSEALITSVSHGRGRRDLMSPTKRMKATQPSPAWPLTTNNLRLSRTQSRTSSSFVEA